MNPDVIFFLTDAAEPQLSSSQLEEIRQKNNRVGASIHAIEFGAGPQQGGVNFLMRLARQNGGTHVYVDVTQPTLELNRRSDCNTNSLLNKGVCV